MTKEKLVNLSKPPLLSDGTADEKRQQIKRYFLETWELYESLFSLIKDDSAFYLRPEPLRHPLIFYYGHTAVFYMNKLILGKFHNERINPHLESICAVGVDEMSWDDLKPDNYQWPGVDEVRNYRSQMKQLLCRLIDEMPLALPIKENSLAWIMLMGAEHERIHIETSSVIMRMLDLKYLRNDPQWRACNSLNKAPTNKLLPVTGQSLILGKPASNDTYGWDNEYGQQENTVNDFRASQYLVSNGEFMAFVEAGGYKNTEYWDEEGQNWLSYTKAKMPRFWDYREGTYLQRNLLNESELPMNWPVEVNYLEAKAFCNWKAKQTNSHIRLPTEAEWQVMRNQLQTDLPYWEEAPGNINLEHYASSCPVDYFPQGAFFDVIGNVWQWTESAIDAYEGFAVHPLYDDFSTPTFDGRHNLIKGGSWISTGNEATRDSRYAFRRHFFQHAGFRYIESDSPEIPVNPVNPFETQAEISQMLHHHYGEPSQAQEHDLRIMSEIAANSTGARSRVLDLGCGTGRLTYELAKTFDQADGIDFTARHIQHALHFKEQGQIRYALPHEGEIQSFHEISLRDLALDDVVEKAQFVQGDAHNLKPQFTGYDVIVCHRLLEHLYAPTRFLKNIASRLNSKGILILSSAYQWNADELETGKWIGGTKRDGENLTTLEGLKLYLQHNFEHIEQTEVSTVLQMNARHAQLWKNQVSIWRKHS